MATTVEIGVYLTTGDTPYFRLDDPVKGKLNNTSYRLAGPIFYDITSEVRNVTVKRGKNRELDRYSAGNATVSLNNQTRLFDPLNTDSIFYGNIIPRRQIRVRSGGYNQFVGVVEDWNLDYDISGQSLASITAADGFTLLAQQSLTPGTATPEKTGARIEAVLSQPSVAWPLADRIIDTGNSDLGADVFDGNVLSYLQLVETSEQGQFFINRDGYVRFVNGAVTPTSGNKELVATNLVTNPSMEASSGVVTVRTNLVTNPSMEAVSTGSVVMRRNLCTNSSFEVDLTGWTVSGGTGTRDTTTFYSGTASLKIVTPGSAGNEGTYSSTAAPGGLIAGSLFSVSAWVKAPAGATMELYATSLGAGNVFKQTIFTGTGSWQLVKAEGATLGASVDPYVVVRTGATAQAITFYVDAVIIEAGSKVGDFFDGSTTDALGWDYAWSGTANASISTAACAATTVRTNRVINPSFESNVGSWNSARATLGRDTTKARFGSASAKLTVIDASSQSYLISGADAGSRATVTGGETVRVLASVWPDSSQASFSLQLYEYDSAGTLITPVIASSQIAVTPGQWNDISASLTVKANAASVRIVVIPNSGNPVGTVWWVDAIAMGTGLTAFFDGSFQPAGDFSYGWSGTANASTSIQRGATVVGLVNQLNTSYQSSAQSYSGSKSLAIFYPLDSMGVTYFDHTVTASVTYTASAWVKGEAGKVGMLRLEERTSSAQVGATAASVTFTGSWQRVNVTRTFGSTGTKARVVFYNGSSTFTSQTIYVDALMLEASPIVQDYFDGSVVSADADLTNSWSGTAHASTSVMRGVGVTGTADPFNNSAGYQSGLWAQSGSKSVRITPITANGDTFVSPGGDVGAVRLGMVAGTTYTVSGTIRLSAAQTGSPTSNARRIVVFTRVGAGAYVETKSTQATNAAGTTRLSLTFTVPAGATEAFIRLYNGASAGNGEVWWDDLLVVEGTYTGDYFDGSTTSSIPYSYRWTGTENASTSVKELSTLPLFSDAGDGIPYVAASVQYGTELLYNQVDVSYPAGTASADNTESQTKYGISATDVSTLLSTGSSAEGLADYWVARYGEPDYRFDAIDINLNGVSGVQAETVLQLELGDVIAMKFTPNGVGSPIERYLQIISINHTVGPDSHIVKIGVSSLQFSFLVLDDDGFGILDENALAF